MLNVIQFLLLYPKYSCFHGSLYWAFTFRAFFLVSFGIVTYKPVAKRWLCKQRPLLGNARNIIACNNRRNVFYVVRAATVAVQRRGKHASAKIKALCFLRGPCRWVFLKTVGETELSSVREAVKKRDSCKSVAIKKKTSCVIFGVCNSVRLLQFLC
jgi:hypothetical protein